MQQGCLWALRREATHLKNTTRLPNRPGKSSNGQINQIIQQILLTEKKTITNHEQIFLGQTNTYRNTGRPLR